MAYLQSVGKFFGISTTNEGDTIKEWQDKIERQIKKQEFGINLKKSLSTVKRPSSARLLSKARKVLSLVEAAPIVDDNTEGDMNVDVRQAAKPCLEITLNKIYYTDDEIDFPKENVTDSVKSSSISTKDKLHTTEHSCKPMEIVDMCDFDTPLSEVRPNTHVVKDYLECSEENSVPLKSHEQSDVKETVTDDISEETLSVSHSSESESGAESIERVDIMPDSETQSEEQNELEKKKCQPLRPEDLVYGKDAYIHYKFYTQTEKKLQKRCLEKELQEKMVVYDWKIQAVDEIVTLAKDYYWNPKTKNADKWKNLKRRVKKSSSLSLAGSANRRKLDSIPEYRPFFTVFIILAQLISFTVVCWLGGFTYIGVQPRLFLEEDVQTVLGMETVHKWTPPNIWIGPNQKYMISVGGVYAPCMREDIEIQLLYSKQNFSVYSLLGCCEIKNRNTAATTTHSECSRMTEGVGIWRAGSTCSKRSPEEASVRHVLKPCCVGNQGQCRLLSYKHCTFLNGYFHRTGPEHCSQVNCLQSYCKLGNLQSSADQPWQPESPNQWWRVPLSLLYHHGIIHVVLVIVAQCLLLVQMERTAGWLRMMIIYLLSGTGALMISVIMDPYHCHVGSVGAVFGMVGVTLMELVQFWKIIQSPVRELTKLLGAVLLFILCGTLPYLNIFGMLGGLVIGILTGVVLLPFVTFSKWKTRIRIVLIIFVVPLLVLIFLILTHVFQVVQSTESCTVCKHLNCVPYTDKMCDAKLWQQ